LRCRRCCSRAARSCGLSHASAARRRAPQVERLRWRASRRILASSVESFAGCKQSMALKCAFPVSPGRAIEAFFYLERAMGLLDSVLGSVINAQGQGGRNEGGLGALGGLV